MRSFTAICVVLATIFFSQPLHSQSTIELWTSFPFQNFAGTDHNYFLTTQYSIARTVEIHRNFDCMATFSYTQHSVPFIQIEEYGRIGALVESRSAYLPYTTDKFYPEYGLFTGGRVKTSHQIVQLFLSGQFGVTASSYRMLKEKLFEDPNSFPEQVSSRIEKGNVYEVDLALLYGAGIMLHPADYLSLVLDLHAINPFAARSPDIYQGIGLQLSF